MNTTKIAANERGIKDYGWLKTSHSFTFGDYYNEEKINFGKLRVLNDDIIAAGTGFKPHDHANMEIITIPLKGALAHKDSTGSSGIIRPNEVQIMSAGTGIEHSEMNHIKNGETHFLQLWILPKEHNTTPKYDQQYFDPHHRQNKWQYVVSNKHNGALNINQDAIIALSDLEKGQTLSYPISDKHNGVYLFVIDGEIFVDNTSLKSKDAITIEQTETFIITATSIAKLLAIEVPMN